MSGVVSHRVVSHRSDWSVIVRAGQRDNLTGDAATDSRRRAVPCAQARSWQYIKPKLIAGSSPSSSVRVLRLRNDLRCVGWGVKLHSHSLSVSTAAGRRYTVAYSKGIDDDDAADPHNSSSIIHDRRFRFTTNDYSSSSCKSREKHCRRFNYDSREWLRLKSGPAESPDPVSCKPELTLTPTLFLTITTLTLTILTQSPTGNPNSYFCRVGNRTTQCDNWNKILYGLLLNRHFLAWLYIGLCDDYVEISPCNLKLRRTFHVQGIIISVGIATVAGVLKYFCMQLCILRCLRREI